MQHNNSSTNQSAIFTENRKITNVHIVTDDIEVLETIPNEDISWIDSMYIQPDNNTIYSAKGNSKVHNVHKQEVTKYLQE